MKKKMILGWISILLVLVVAISFINNRDNKSLSHAIKAIEFSNLAADLINRLVPYQTSSQEEWKPIYEYMEKALAEAKLADINSMNQYYSGWGDHFKNEFIKGYELWLEGSKNESDTTKAATKSLAGQVLIDRFGQWYEKNTENIRAVGRNHPTKRKNVTTQVFMFLSVGFGIIYVMLIFLPFSEQIRTYRITLALCFCGALMSLLIFIYLYKNNILWVLVAIPLAFLAQILFQIISGSIWYYIKVKRGGTP